MERTDARFAVANAVVSISAVAFLGWLILLNRGVASDLDLSFVPALNAVLNATSAVLLVAAVSAIKKGDRETHKRLVLGALVSSALFLSGYVAYHAVHGDTRFAGEGAAKVAYLVLLASHVILSIAVLPMIFTCLYLAAQERFETHRKVARWTFPIWLYVSVTGVIVFFVLRGSRG